MSREYDSNQPSLINSVVCFMDILGYKSLGKNALKENNGDTAEEFLRNLHNSLRKAKRSITPDPSLPAKVKVFTDNIVIGWPILEDGEMELGTTFVNIANYQLQLALDGFFIRGGISNGKHFMDEETVFGPELFETYTLESEVAVYPRVVLSNKSKELIKRFNTEYYGGIDSPFYEAILEDMDGEWFLNYLIATKDEDRGAFNLKLIEMHKQKVVAALLEYSQNYKLLKKYAWIANYHNFFCDKFLTDSDEFKIDTPILMSDARQIFK
ncbi:hypothetical protein [Terribacillus saccharophilus]|uniref:hypothetical protein n=1 Tax=Terribacillus saccharophilus TaxID=361277 RepID=UPI003D267088